MKAIIVCFALGLVCHAYAQQVPTAFERQLFDLKQSEKNLIKQRRVVMFQMDSLEKIFDLYHRQNERVPADITQSFLQLVNTEEILDAETRRIQRRREELQQEMIQVRREPIP